MLGRGSYGSVYKAQDTDTGFIFAVKQMQIQDDRQYADKLEMEISICSSLRHPNIVSYLGHETVDQQMCIFLEYVPGGSMSSVLSEFGLLAEPLLRKATWGCLDGLSYLHSRSPPVVHRDIKCANLLVDMNCEVKLADFGCSKRHAETQSFTTIGSIPWMAPEVITSSEGHGRKADIWSLGCTIIEMATAQKPWGDGFFENFMFALQHIGMSDATPPVPKNLPQDLLDLLESCLHRDPAKRPTAAQLFRRLSPAAACAAAFVGGA